MDEILCNRKCSFEKIHLGHEVIMQHNLLLLYVRYSMFSCLSVLCELLTNACVTVSSLCLSFSAEKHFPWRPEFQKAFIIYCRDQPVQQMLHASQKHGSGCGMLAFTAYMLIRSCKEGKQIKLEVCSSDFYMT